MDETKQTDRRKYPFSYSHNCVKAIIGSSPNGIKLYSSHTSKIIELIKIILKIDEYELAERMAHYYIMNKAEMEQKSLEDFVKAITTKNKD